MDRRIQLRNNGKIRDRIDKIFNFNCDKLRIELICMPVFVFSFVSYQPFPI